MGIFKSLFGKSDGNPHAGMSADGIENKIAEHNNQIEQLKRKLPSTSALESRNKSITWMGEMQEKLKTAKTRGNFDEIKKLEDEIKESAKKAGRIEKHIDEINKQILHHEDEIELLSRALSSAK